MCGGSPKAESVSVVTGPMEAIPVPATARRGSDLSKKRYDAGYVSYLEVVDAQRTALEVERADAQLTGQRWITHVALIKALGGGWSPPTS